MQKEPYVVAGDGVAAEDDDDLVFMGTTRSLSEDQDRERRVSSPSTSVALQSLLTARHAPAAASQGSVGASRGSVEATGQKSVDAASQGSVDSDDEMTDAQAEWLLSNSVKNRHASDLGSSKH